MVEDITRLSFSTPRSKQTSMRSFNFAPIRSPGSMQRRNEGVAYGDSPIRTNRRYGAAGIGRACALAGQNWRQFREIVASNDYSGIFVTVAY